MEWREEVEAYVGPNAGKYRDVFARFRKEEGSGFAFSWNWPAFFAGVWWYLYRKMYLWALVDFVVSVALGWTFFVPLFWAVIRAATGNYLYFLQAERKIEEARRLSPGSQGSFAVTGEEGGGATPIAGAATSDRLAQLRREGGVHRWIAWAAVLGILLLVGISALFFRLLWGMIPELRHFWEARQGVWT